MGSGGKQEIRYAPHIEAFHKLLLEDVYNTISYTHGRSPYQSEYERYDIDDAFFGRVPGDPDRTYEMRHFPSLYDMFGKFMAGLDVHALWGNVYEDAVHGPEIEAAVSAHNALIDNEVKTKVLPSFLAGMRDINAIQSTTFVIGKAIIADGQVRQLNEFQSRIRLSAVELSGQLWRTHLDWDKSVISTYLDMTKLYYATRMDVDKDQLEFMAKDRMWDLELLDSFRTAVGALNGAASIANKNQPSQTQKAIAGTLSGAATGASVSGGNPYAVGAGAILGLGSSFIN